MEAYLRTLQQGLKLDPEEARAVVAEVRGNLEDLTAHLRAEGYAADEAGREALRRFDDAARLARDLRRARRRPPLPLQALALILGAIGACGFVLAISLLGTVGGRLWAVAHNAASSSDSATDLVGGLVILTGALASIVVAFIILTGQRTRREWLVGLAAVAVYDAIVAIPLLGVLPGAGSPPVPVPGAARLTALGLAGRPAAGQPAGPVVVDQVYADRTITYVRYHIPNAARDGEPFPALTDDRGRRYDFNFIDCDPCNGSFGGKQRIGGMRQALPWRVAEQGLARFSALRSDSRAAVVSFSQWKDGTPIETVRVPLDLRGWRRATGGTHPFIVTQGRGIRVNLTRAVRGLTFSTIDYTIDATRAVVPNGGSMYNVNATLTGARDQPISPIPWSAGGDAFGSGCRVVAGGGGHCGPTWLLPPIPKGARLTLTVRSVMIYPHDYGGPGAYMLNGPWRIRFVMP